MNAFLTVKNFGEAAPFYYGGTLVFGVITVVGLVALVVVWRTYRRASGPAET